MESEATHTDGDYQRITSVVIKAIADFTGNLGLQFQSSTEGGLQTSEASKASLKEFFSTILSCHQQFRDVLNANVPIVESGSNKKRKADDEATRSGEELVQIRADERQMEERILHFIDAKRDKINTSNRKEFLKATDTEGSCARVDAVQINRVVQMKLDVVHNFSGPLDRSTSANHSNPNSEATRQLDVQDGLEERIQNLQKHINVDFATPSPLTAIQRVKALEDRLIQLEEAFPMWAAFHFSQPRSDLISNRVLQLPPPLTVISQTRNGDLQSSVIPPLPITRQSGTTIGQTPNTGGSDPQPDDNSTEEPDSSNSKSDVESIRQRIQSLKESLLHKQQQSR